MPELHFRRLRILMVNHHRRSKIHFALRSLAMAKHMARRGHQVVLLTTADTRKTGIVESNADGVKIVEIPDLLSSSLRSGWDPWSALNRLIYLLRCEDRFDLIHLFESRPAVIHPIQIYRMQQKLPLVIDWVDWIGRGGIMEVRRPFWYRVLFGGLETFYEEHYRARADGLTVICSALRKRAQGLGISSENILQIPIGVDLDNYPTVLDKVACRKTMNIPQNVKVIVFAGVDADFDLPLVFGSLAKVIDRYPETCLMIIGKAGSAIHILARQYGLTDQIISTGYVPMDRFPICLGCADVFLLPFTNSIYNMGRWPSKVCDYMASGRPIVSNPTGDIAVLFEKHAIGLLAEDNADDFAKKIICLLDDPNLANELGRNARRAAESEYAWGRLIEGLENFYYKILKSDDVYDN